MFSLLWPLYLLFISAVVAFFSYALFFRKEELIDSTPVRTKIKYLRKHVPPTYSNGWQLKTVDSGLRVWQKNMCSSSPSWMPETIYACSGIIPASQQEVINILKQPGLLMNWDPTVKIASKVSMATNHDDISVSFHCSSIITRAVQQIRAMFGEEANAVYSRQWEISAEPTPEAWFMSSFSDRIISAEGALWSCFLLSPIDTDNGADEETDSLVTLVVAPVSPIFASFVSAIPQLTASRVAGLQDFCSHYKPDTSTVNCSTESEATVRALSPSSTSDNANLEENAIASPASLQATEEIKSTVPDDSSHLPEFASSESIEKMLQKLHALYEGGEGTDGWKSVGNYKGVDILKRPAQAGERPWDTLKGTAVVSVPMHYVLAYINSLDFRGEWDELFLKGEVVEQYSPLTKVTRMEYSPVWPASARDFCTFHHTTELAEGVFCMACEAVEHENCPDCKGLVRADFIIGGFVVKELNPDPPSCLVTYITRVDLKGNLPTRLINRVTSSQPQAVAVLRDKLEALYMADLSFNSDDMSQIEKEGVDLWKALMRAKQGVCEEKESLPECSLEEKPILNSRSCSVSGSKSEGSVVSDSGEMFPITDENMQLPFVDRQNIDFRTLGSQAVANLLGEVLLADQLQTPTPKNSSENVSKDREWSCQGTEKDVSIFQKINPGEKIYSFLGKGLIKVQPSAVWEAVRNHMSRHVYDRMLKKIQLIRQIDEETKILYLHHEAKQCILKQARDCVLLTMEREESEKYVQASLSVQLPELPPSKDIIRAKVYSSGWIIEPVKQDGQLYSSVSYLLQVDFGGIFPARLMNLVARRQPLCIAYLRDYLEKSQD